MNYFIVKKKSFLILCFLILYATLLSAQAIEQINKTDIPHLMDI
jgi:hypothetical protein